MDGRILKTCIAQEATRERGAAGGEEAARWRQAEPEREAEDFRAVAPPVMSFASGRRR